MTSLPSNFFGLFYPYNILIALFMIILFRFLIAAVTSTQPKY